MIGNIDVQAAIAVWGFLAGIGLWKLGRRVLRYRTDYRFRWTCPRCGFRVKGSDPGLVAHVVERHEWAGHDA